MTAIPFAAIIRFLRKYPFLGSSRLQNVAPSQFFCLITIIIRLTAVESKLSALEIATRAYSLPTPPQSPTRRMQRNEIGTIKQQRRLKQNRDARAARGTAAKFSAGRQSDFYDSLADFGPCCVREGLRQVGALSLSGSTSELVERAMF